MRAIIVSRHAPIDQHIFDHRGEKLYTSRQISKAFSLTLRQVQWLDEANIIPPSIHSGKRLYTLTDALTIGVVSVLRESMSLQLLRTFLPSLTMHVSFVPLYLIVGIPNNGRPIAREAEDWHSAIQAWAELSNKGIPAMCIDTDELKAKLEEA